MDTRVTEPMEEPIAETPEDVAILYSWANLHGAKYRDFSASRREYRAQVRHRAAEETREAEQNAQAKAEQAAVEAERIAREAERAVRISERYDSQADRERAMHEAEVAARRAATERVEAARRADGAAVAEATARQEKREIADAHLSAQRQAARWYDSEGQRRSLAGPQPTRVPALDGDPYEIAQGATVDGDLFTPNRALEYTQPQRYREDEPRGASSHEQPVDRGMGRGYERPVERGYSGLSERRAPRTQTPESRLPRGLQQEQESGYRLAYRSGAIAAFSSPTYPLGSDALRLPQPPTLVLPPSEQRSPSQESFAPEATRRLEERAWEEKLEPATPAWLHSGQASSGRPAVSSAPLASVADTLQHSRERVASRWFALKGAFAGEEQPVSDTARSGPKDMRVPVLAVFSLAGGVGKTSMVATLGRALSSLGEKVLLAESTSHGLLPYYFGATELKGGAVRTFSPANGSSDAPIQLVSYYCDECANDRGLQDTLLKELTFSAAASQRLLLDLSPASSWIIRRTTHMNPTVLVPLAPDMNSVISLQAVERYFKGVMDGNNRPLQPLYIINQFDSTLPLHLDVREVLRRQLGNRLLPNVIRRSPAVSEALAEGMTVMDYAPNSPTSEDFLHVANWLRGMSITATQGYGNVRWSER